jgi:hypothetical protein
VCFEKILEFEEILHAVSGWGGTPPRKRGIGSLDGGVYLGHGANRRIAKGFASRGVNQGKASGAGGHLPIATNKVANLSDCESSHGSSM